MSLDNLPPELLTEHTQIITLLEGGLGKYFEKAMESTNPYGIDFSEFDIGPGNFTIEKYFLLVKAFLTYAQMREGTKNITPFVEEYPQEEFWKFGYDVITYRIKSRRPASTSPDRSGHKEYNHRYQNTEQLAGHPNQALEVRKRDIDHRIEFSAWSKSARLANARGLWLERILSDHSWIFIASGATRMQWEGNPVNVYHQIHGQRIYQRPVDFFVRIPEYKITSHSVLRDIEYEINLNQ